MLFIALFVASGILLYTTIEASEQQESVDEGVKQFRKEVLTPFVSEFIKQNKTKSTTSEQQTRLLNLVVAIEQGLVELSPERRDALFYGDSAAGKYFRALLINIAFGNGWIVPYAGGTPMGDKAVTCWTKGEEAKLCADFKIYFEPFVWMDTAATTKDTLTDFDTFKENIATLIGGSVDCWKDTIAMIESDKSLSSTDKAYYLQIMLRGALRFYADVIAKQKEAKLGMKGIRLATDAYNYIRGRLPDHYIESAGRALYSLKGDFHHVYYYEFVDIVDSSLREFLTGTLEKKEIDRHAANLKNKMTRHWVFKNFGKIFSFSVGGVVGGVGMLSAYQIGWQTMVGIFKAKGALAVVSAIGSKTLTNLYDIPAGTMLYAKYVGGRLVGYVKDVTNYALSFMPESVKTKFGMAKPVTEIVQTVQAPIVQPKEGYFRQIGRYAEEKLGYTPAWAHEVVKPPVPTPTVVPQAPQRWYSRAYQGARAKVGGYFAGGRLERAGTAIKAGAQKAYGYGPSRGTVARVGGGIAVEEVARRGYRRYAGTPEIPQGMEGVDITPSVSEQAELPMTVEQMLEETK